MEFWCLTLTRGFLLFDNNLNVAHFTQGEKINIENFLKLECFSSTEGIGTFLSHKWHEQFRKWFKRKGASYNIANNS